MLFRRLFICALFIGVLTGLFDSAVQRWQVVPLIFAAEVFNDANEPVSQSHEHEHTDGAAHSHEAQAKEPQPGFERTAYTVLANMLNATGLALVLLPFMVLLNRQRGGQSLTLQKSYGEVVRHGLLWGAAAWTCLFAMPSLGLPPELPGMQAAPLQARQLWWALTVACGAGGLAMVCLVRTEWRVLGLALLVVPFAIGTPHHEGSAFAGMSADVAAQMQVLASRFVVATSIASALQCLLMGALCALAAARWLSPLLRSPAQSAVPSPVVTGSVL